MAAGKGIQIVVGTDYNDKDLKRAQRDLDRLKGQAAKTAGPMAKLGNTLRANVGPALAMAAAAAGALAVKFAVDGVKAAAAEEAALAKLSTALNNVGQGFAEAQVNTFIDDLQRATGVADDQLRPAFQQLVTATRDAAQAQELLSLALDISVGSGRSLESVSLALAKAATGQTTALRRLGVPLSDAAVKSGDLRAITDELADAFGGQAAVAAETFEGQLKRLGVAFGELQESFGKGFLDALGDTNGQTNDLMDSIEALEPVMYDLGENIGTLVKALGDFEEATGGVSAVLKGLLDVTGPTLDAILYFYRVLGQGEDPVEALKQQFFGLGEGYGDVAEGAGDAAWLAGKAGEVFGTTAAMAGEMADETDDAADALKILNDEMKEFFGFLDERDAVRGYQEAIDNLRKSLKENGKTFDVNTEAGRNNEEALDGVFENALKVAEGQATASEKIDTMKEAARQAARQLDKTKMSDSAKAALLAPFDAAIAKFQSANTKVDNLKAAMESIPTKIRVDVTINGTYVGTPPPGGWPRQAYGGYVGGDGGSRADDVPTLLSSGEFVIQAPAVEKFGRGFFASLNQGVNPLQGMTPKLGGSAAGFTINGGIHVVSAPGERAETSLPRALRRASFLAGVNG
jgi:hypothetical protein